MFYFFVNWTNLKRGFLLVHALREADRRLSVETAQIFLYVLSRHEDISSLPVTYKQIQDALKVEQSWLSKAITTLFDVDYRGRPGANLLSVKAEGRERRVFPTERGYRLGILMDKLISASPAELESEIPKMKNFIEGA